MRPWGPAAPPPGFPAAPPPMQAPPGEGVPPPDADEAAPARPHPGPRPALVAIGICIWTALVLWNSWSRDFWAPEEPDFAAVLKDMTRRGDWISPTIGGELYAEKPPLIYWASLLSAKLLPWADVRFSWRLPAALAGALALWVTYFAGRRLFDGRTAALGTLIAGSSFIFFNCSSRLLTDMPFAALCALSAASFGIALLLEPGNRRWALTGWAALAAAGLAKSVLLAPALVLGPILVLAILQRGGPGLRRNLLGLRPLEGAVLFCAITAPWYILMTFRHGMGFIDVHFLEQNIGRLLDADSHRQGFFFYILQTLWGDFMPWALLIPLVLLSAKVHFRRTGIRFFAIWAIWVLFLLSCISSKQGKYLLPLWPALSLLVAASLLMQERERESIWEDFLGPRVLQIMAWILRIPMAVALAVAVFWGCGGDLGSLVHPFAKGAWDDVRGVLESRELVLGIIVLAVLIGAACYASSVWLSRRLREGRPASAISAIGAAALAVQLALSFGFGEMNRFKSCRALGEEVDRIVPKERQLALYGRNRSAVHYFVEHPLVHLRAVEKVDSPEAAALDRYLKSPEQVFLLVEKEELLLLKSKFPTYEDRIRVRQGGLRMSSRARALLVTN